MWLCAGAVLCAGIWSTYVTCPGCIERQRINKTCDWAGDVPFPIDSQDSTHQKHLVADAHLAEELAIRYADAEFGRRFGVEHHGGLIDGGEFRRACLVRLFDAITLNHGVTAEHIRRARGERNAVYDAAVGVLFVPVYVFVVSIACRSLSRRFSADARPVQWLAQSVAALCISVLGLQAFRLWAAIWEVIRVGNGHMTSMRLAALNRWPHQYPGVDFVVALLLFWLIAAWCSRTTTNDEARGSA